MDSAVLLLAYLSLFVLHICSCQVELAGIGSVWERRVEKAMRTKLGRIAGVWKKEWHEEYNLEEERGKMGQKKKMGGSEK